jgi:phosphoserine phosphatase RsbU/P
LLASAKHKVYRFNEIAVTKDVANQLRIYAEQRVETVQPAAETIAWLPELQRAFQQATGWCLRYVTDPEPCHGTRINGFAPANGINKAALGQLRLEVPQQEAMPSPARGEGGKQRQKTRSKMSNGPDTYASPQQGAPTIEPKSAARLVSALDGMLKELRETRHALWQREAELAAGVPLVPQREEEKHVAARLEAVLRGGAEAVGCTAAALYLLDEATTELKLRSCWGLAFERLTAPARPLQGATADQEALLGHVVVLDDAVTMPYWRAPEDFPVAVCVPVSTATTLLGTLWFFATQPCAFDDHQTNLLEIVAGRVAAELEREMLLREGLEAVSLKRQLAAAERLQRSQLPVVAPLLDGWELAGWTDQSQPVGGDFYDWFCLPNGLLAVGVGHAMDQGIAAALAANTLKALVRAHGQYHREAQQALKKINLTLWTGSAGDQRASLFYGLLETATGRLCSAIAGEPCAVLLRNDGWQLLNQTSPRLGESPESDYEQFGYQLQPGEAILIFTEGVFDMVALKDHSRNMAPLLEPLLPHLHLSAEALATAVREHLVAHTGGSTNRRDRSVLVLKRTR